MMRYLLGLDVGTTAIKGVLFNEEGESIAQFSSEYNLDLSKPDFVELNPDIYWESAKKVIRQILAKSKRKPKEIKALSISSQGETLICVDREGNPLRKAIVWLDNRSKKEAEIIEEEFGVKKIYYITGQPQVVPTWPATKILWLRKNERDIFNKTYKYLLLEDYLIYKLTGEFVCEYSLVSSTLLFDINKKCWWKDMLELVGIDEEMLPEIRESGQVVGNLTEVAAKDTGLSCQTLVVTGALDQAAGAIGAGNIKPGIITETTGAALAIVATTQAPIFDPQMRIPCHCHALKNKYFLLPWCQTAGTVLKWFRDEFSKEEMREAEGKNVDAYNILSQKAAKIPPGSEGLIMLPHLSGAACPEFNPSAKGVWFGFTLKHTKAHFTRSIMEAIAFMLKRNIRLLENSGVNVKEIRALGGGAKSRLWNQIKADVINKPVITSSQPESASLGVAILAAVAVGIFDTVKEACNKMVMIGERFSPSSENIDIYSRQYETYLRLYEKLQGLF